MREIQNGVNKNVQYQNSNLIFALDKYERKKRENEIVEENETNINREGQLEKSQKWEETLSKQ